jgi:hypothetical protein
MGTTDITNTKSNGDVIDETWYNDFRSTIIGNFVPRNASSGAVDNSAPDLGALIYPWGNLYANGLVINGVAVDFASVTGIPNSIKSGQTRTTSEFPDFIRATGSSNSFTLLASAVNLVVDINTTETTFTQDLTETGLTLAPSTNNTCLLDEPTATGQYETSYLGEDNTVITIDNAGTEITNRIGQFCLFQTGTEYFLAYINSATQLTNAYRGFLLDSSGNPVNRTVLNDNDVITLLSGGWVFVDIDGVTIDVTYNSPVYDFDEPTSPVTGDYWFNRSEEAWYRYSGSAFVSINRTLVGVVALDTANCVAQRCFNFNREFSDYNPLNLQYVNATTVKTDFYNFVINVYGNKIINQNTRYFWDITTDLESGQIEANDTYYFLYITELGQQVISNIKPYDQKGELGGYYHPFNTWRAIGSVANDLVGDFVDYTVSTYEKPLNIREIQIKTSKNFYKPLSSSTNKIIVRGWGGGQSGNVSNTSGNCRGGSGSSCADLFFDLKNLSNLTFCIIGAGGAPSTTLAINLGGNSFFGVIEYGTDGYRSLARSVNGNNYNLGINTGFYSLGFGENLNNIDRNAIAGGAGGGVVFGATIAGTSVFGGNGGYIPTYDGEQPGGGGCGVNNAQSPSGAGGDGQLTIMFDNNLQVSNNV